MKHFAYVGSYTDKGKEGGHRAEGIYLYERDLETGKLSLVSGQATLENPSFLRMHPSKKLMYAVVELVEGGASSFAVNPENGSLTLLNSQPTKGVHPCHLDYDPAGKFALVSNYSSGCLSIFPILADGTLAPMSDFIEHRGSGPHKNQDRPHAHSMAFDPSGTFLLAADLGLDRIFVYRLDPATGKLELHDLSGAAMHPGAGPRHFVFHANQKILYVANELNSTVTVCTWDAQKGILVPVQNVPTLPADFTGHNAVADIHLHPSGNVLYVSNRGHNSLAVFKVLEDGMLEPIGHAACGGNWPRNFAVDPGGRWLYVANQLSSNLATYRVDAVTGWLELVDTTLEVNSPVCIELVDL